MPRSPPRSGTRSPPASAEARHRGLNAIHLGTGRTYTLALGAPALGLALSPDEAVLFVSLITSGRVIVVETRSLAVAATLTTGGRPRRIALVPNEGGWVDFVR